MSQNIYTWDHDKAEQINLSMIKAFGFEPFDANPDLNIVVSPEYGEIYDPTQKAYHTLPIDMADNIVDLAIKRYTRQPEDVFEY